VISQADDRIGQLHTALHQLKLTENTLVIFSSDNGPARAGAGAKLDLSYDTATGAGWGIAASKGTTAGRKGYKAALFEGGINVPFIARWPGRIAAGKVDHTSLISAVDLLPTFCEITGAKPPSSYVADGVSQVAALKGRAAPSRSKPLFWRIGANWPSRKDAPDHWAAHAIVDAHWKLLLSPRQDHVELYDLQQDPMEKADLSQSYPDVVTQLRQKLAAWHSTLPPKPTGDVFSQERAQ